MKYFLSVAAFCLAASFTSACTPTVTTVSGSQAPSTICSGQLIFEDNFNTLDQSKWRHENTLAGGGNWEFQCEFNLKFSFQSFETNSSQGMLTIASTHTQLVDDSTLSRHLLPQSLAKTS